MICPLIFIDNLGKILYYNMDLQRRKEGYTMKKTERERVDDILAGIDLNNPPPTDEPKRQYYFIKKCREIIKKKSEELGRPLYACSVCMGCQMNTEHEIKETRINKGFYKTPTAKKRRAFSFCKNFLNILHNMY